MNAFNHGVLEGAIHQSVPGDGILPVERRGHDNGFVVIPTTSVIATTCFP